MKYPILIVAAASLVASQAMGEYFPECSVDCLEDAVPDASDCSVEDSWCVCIQENYEKIVTKATTCVMLECGADTALGEVLPAAIPFCSAASSSYSITAAATPSSTGDSSSTTSSGASETTGSGDDDEESSEEGGDGNEGEGAAETSSPSDGSGIRAAHPLAGFLVVGALAFL